MRARVGNGNETVANPFADRSQLEHGVIVFSCRAECQDDVDLFIEAAKAADVEMLVRAFADKIFPDVKSRLLRRHRRTF